MEMKNNASLQDNIAGKVEKFIDVLNAKDAIEPEVLLLPEEYALADAMIVAQASSRRNAQAIADAISQLCAQNNFEFLGMEGYADGEWILLDCNDIVAHIMREETRKLYRLEELWARSAQRKEALE